MDNITTETGIHLGACRKFDLIQNTLSIIIEDTEDHWIPRERNEIKELEFP